MQKNYTLDPKSTWPLPVETKALETVVQLNKLNRFERANVWRSIEEARPDIAQLLVSMKRDECLQKFLIHFDATLAIYDEDLKLPEAQ